MKSEFALAFFSDLFAMTKMRPLCFFTFLLFVRFYRMKMKSLGIARLYNLQFYWYIKAMQRVVYVNLSSGKGFILLRWALCSKCEIDESFFFISHYYYCFIQWKEAKIIC